MSSERSVSIVVLCLCLTFLFKEHYVSGARRLRGAAIDSAPQLRQSDSEVVVGFLSTRYRNVTLPPALQEALLRDSAPVANRNGDPGGGGLPSTLSPILDPDGESFGEKPSIALMTLLDRLAGVYTWMWPMSYHTKAVYCKRMGYDLIVGSAADVEPQRSSHWAKLTMLLRWLPHYNYIMWMDADTLVTRFNFAVDSLVVPGIDIVMARDWNNINSGVFVVRNSSFSIGFIKACLAVPLASLVVPAWQEQAAMIYVLDRKPKYLSHFYIPPQRMLNSYPAGFAEGHDTAQWRPGDFLAHTPACHGRETQCRQVFIDTYQQVAKQWRLPPIPQRVPLSHYPKAIQRAPPSFSNVQNTPLSQPRVKVPVRRS